MHELLIAPKGIYMICSILIIDQVDQVLESAENVKRREIQNG